MSNVGFLGSLLQEDVKLGRSPVRMVLFRVGIDSGCGGIHGPLFRDGTFEFVPIPDSVGVDERTYGNTRGRHGRALVEYFPERRRAKASETPMHVDPEFETFTYGDPPTGGPKVGLKSLKSGDVLVFYAGLEGWGFKCPPALYIVGYFVVEAAGLAADFGWAQLREAFGLNFHVRHASVFARDRETLVLVKGGYGSRLLKYAHCISSVGCDRNGRPLKVLSQDAVRIFGNFEGRTSIQRSPPRWVAEEFVGRAWKYLSALT